MSRTRKGKKRTKETCLRISISRLGHEVTPQTRAKIGAGHVGKTLSKETRDKIGDSNRGKPMSEGTKNSLVGWNPYQAARAKKKRGAKLTKKECKAIEFWESKPLSRSKERKLLLQSGYGHPWRLAGLDEETQRRIG